MSVTKSLLESRLCCLTADAAGDTKGGCNSRQNRNDCLNNKFPSFLFHNSSLSPRPLRGEGAEVLRTLLNC